MVEVTLRETAQVEGGVHGLVSYGGSAGRGLYHERSKEVNLLQIYNMDFGNAMELDPHVDPNDKIFGARRRQYRIEHAEQNLHVKLARFRSRKSYGFYETMCNGSNP
ncbi:hypothetical protein COCNU_10G002560 [Cocos nucifera]|uniref:Uncharacterized protein n=1 Tax=Cocos nucifera TaxID=13894 RepID=A0A8K0N836_COCNU|nr:hypothetical protein COCNU_10G002560 [Cocos nucifera]